MQGAKAAHTIALPCSGELEGFIPMRFNRLVASTAFAALSILNLAVPAAQAAAPIQNVQCAVGWVGGPERVVMTMGTWNTQGLVRDAGAVCTTWIATGNWVGANKYTNWKAAGYQFLCQAWFGDAESVDVYALPYYDDRLVGYQTCMSGESLGGRVVYNDVGPALDLPGL